MMKYVYFFATGQAEGNAAMRELLGGKGANLAEMANLGLPIPPGFTITTRACRYYYKHDGKYPRGLKKEIAAALARLEALTGKRLGDPRNPLLVSVRSGAAISMPGMMDTVLNIGLNDETARGMIGLTGEPRFVYDSYRRLVQMFGSVVLGVPDEPFENAITARRLERKVQTDAELSAEDWQALTAQFMEIVRKHTGRDFPQQPEEQLQLAIEAVFKSWSGKRAVDYRNAAGISHDLGTAVNVQTMVFGNLGPDSGTGVATTRNISTGEKEIEGDYLLNAQGEDVVAGIRLTKRIQELQKEMPRIYEQFAQICQRLERHYRDVQDIEFTIERGKLWILQTRVSKRTAQAAVRIAVELAEEGLISREEAVLRVTPEQVDFFLHPQFDRRAKEEALKAGRMIATGLNVAPGAAVGLVAFDADLAERWGKEGRGDGEEKRVIMVRPETKPDDVHGMLAAQGILTSRGGRTSHAALVARQFGKPAVVGCAALNIDLERRLMEVNGQIVREGDYLSIDGTEGQVFLGQLPTVVPDIKDPYLMKLLAWADGFRRLGVRANADYPRDAQRARDYGAEGIGLCRTEHMFFETERLPIVQQMILAPNPEERQRCLDRLLPFQRADFEGLFRAMDGLPVIIRLIDPPLHEFLPSYDRLVREVTMLRMAQHEPELLELERRDPEDEELLKEVRKAGEGDLAAGIRKLLPEKERLLEAVEKMREANPMLGLRGVRLGIHMPEVVKMQVRAIFEAACKVAKEGIKVHPEVMIPITSHVRELEEQRAVLEEVARGVMSGAGLELDYKFGTMIEIPRAALTADEMARHAQFFSFGTNDLTQTVFGISRDDAEAGFLVEYQRKGILPNNPFATIDVEGVGKLMAMCVKLGRKARPELEVGICGEHGGDPATIAFCHKIGLDYVSCSPFRVPIARLAAAQAALAGKAPGPRED
ncbi:MAG: pyruvate, phosphate dikinase [Candidatus Acetothermia bacterium]|jgi:pyruvate,orthophosphate dikinase|nr:pyruvate, phosphate dikinase [Candidatus Acetothermia bacterium]MDH7505743.1 pyruvate, phosphate dikinase [Candidatus Acetothermia bacterium]